MQNWPREIESYHHTCRGGPEAGPGETADPNLRLRAYDSTRSRAAATSSGSVIVASP
jgi:hypothetical protein